MNKFRLTQISIIIISLVLWQGAKSQEFSSTKSIQVYVTKLPQSSETLQKFVTSNQGVVYRTELTSNKYYSQFSIPIKQLPALDSLATSMGYVTSSKYNTENFNEKILALQEKIDNLQYEIDLYTKELSDSAADNNRIDYIKKGISTNNKLIRDNLVKINKYKQNLTEEACKVEFTINDELSTPNNSRVSFVNMPGVEYGFLQIENPKAGLSNKAYHGVAVKYMFTRGKSYLNLGAYRAVENNTTDSSLINELFMVNFGQDFYPKNFGRGKRRYLNLYTGYQIGGFITNRNNEKNGSFVPNFNMTLGLELLKTKHVLIDNKVSYFLPLDDFNRNLRGILYQASFNFVF
ncbi:MAG: hypothetical protein V4590_13575 [Bacteroidota bacterium]